MADNCVTAMICIISVICDVFFISLIFVRYNGSQPCRRGIDFRYFDPVLRKAALVGLLHNQSINYISVLPVCSSTFPLH